MQPYERLSDRELLIAIYKQQEKIMASQTAGFAALNAALAQLGKDISAEIQQGSATIIDVLKSVGTPDSALATVTQTLQGMDSNITTATTTLASQDPTQAPTSSLAPVA